MSPSTKLVLIREDPRTEEEIERDLRREAEALTAAMFAPQAASEAQAKAAGKTLTPTEEIQQEQHQGHILPPPVSATVEPSRVSMPTRPGLGFRVHSRRDLVAVRRREQPQSIAVPQHLLPAQWMQPDYIQKRLLYLSEGMARLDEEELAALAESISEVLQETYWTILGITLAHYFDHEQRERIA